ncbi:MAG: hypothetical protein A2148_01845 [Chloroflexi bacterium RBG_16_68_14]|nr:MAG: hypothetical protein A2148_01845 [Chloroflexi bacterium RBG_16_68_14]
MRAAARALYRSRQFFGSLRPRVDADLRAGAFRLLREPERRLFETMTPRDQQHCLHVYRRLRRQGHDDPDLLAAALLHDVGKGRIALWHRVAYVLLEAWAPGLLRRLAVPGEGSERPAFGGLYRCRHHPELGAELARQAGASDQVVALIRGEDASALGERLVALQAADEA